MNRCCFPLLALGVILLAVPVHSQTFQVALGSIYTDEGRGVMPTADGGAIVSGSTFFIPGRSYDALVARLDANGSLLWMRTHGSAKYEEIYSTARMDDGGILLAGSIYENDPSDYNMMLWRLDSAGNLLWAREYGDSSFEIAYAVTQTMDGNIVLAGYSASDSLGFGDFYLAKVDASGNLLWTQRYGTNTSSEAVTDVAEAPDGSLYFAGNGGGVLLLHTDADGDLIWMNKYFTGDGEYCGGMTVTPDGGVVLCGNAHQPSSLFFIDAFLLRIDGAGAVVWGHRYGGSLQDDVMSVNSFPGGGYVAAGYSNSFGASNADYFAIRVDEGGNYIWAQTYGGIWDHRASGVAAASDGSVFINGYVKDSNQAFADVYLIKADSSGYSGCQEFSIASAVNDFVVNVNAVIPLSSVGGLGQLVAMEDSSLNLVRYFCTSAMAAAHEPESLSFFPNPSEGILQASGLHMQGMAMIELLDARGQCVMRKALWVNDGFSLCPDSLPAGIYFVRLQMNEREWTGKWIKR